MITELLPSLLWALPLLLFSTPAELCMIASAVLLHEGGHVAALLFFGRGATRLRGEATGFRLLPRTMLPYHQELLAALAGPAANLLFFLFTAGVSSFPMTVLRGVHLFYGLSNLLPLGTTDGGRALFDLLALCLPLPAAEKISRGVTFSLGGILFFSLLFLLLDGGGAYALLLLLTLLSWLFSAPSA